MARTQARGFVNSFTAFEMGAFGVEHLLKTKAKRLGPLSGGSQEVLDSC